MLLLRPFLNDHGSCASAFAEALVADMPSPPAEQERIVGANRAGRKVVRA